MTAIQGFDYDNTSVPPNVTAVLRQLKNDLLRIEAVAQIVLFGSYSKGTYDKNSDIDIAVFVDDSAKESLHDIFRQAQRCAAKYVLDIQILIFTKSMLAEPAGIIEEIALYGKDITLL